MNSFGFLIIIIAFAFLWLIVVRPQKRRQVEQQRMLSDLRIGDEVLTAGGIYGQVTGLADDEVTLEIAPGAEVRVARRAVAGVNREPEADDEPVTAQEPDSFDDPDEVEEPDAYEEPDEAGGTPAADDRG